MSCSLEVVRRACQFKIKYYLLVNRAQQSRRTDCMNRYLPLLIIVIATLACSSLLAQEKAALQPNVTVLSVLQGNAGKTVELHLRSGEKMGGKVSQVSENTVHLSALTGAEYFDAFVDAKDISAVVVCVTGKKKILQLTLEKIFARKKFATAKKGFPKRSE